MDPMTSTRLFDQLDNRIALDKQGGDSSYFHALTLKLEYITKLVVSGIVACIGDDTDRHRYSLEYDLARGDSLGTWVRTLQTALTGQAAQFFRTGTQDIVRDLTQRTEDGDWRKAAVTAIHQASLEIGAPPTDIGSKPRLDQFFVIAATLRNRSRGHGATTIDQCYTACPHLLKALDLIVNNLALFNIPWVYLRRNLSGKYHVSPLLNDSVPFDDLRRQTQISLPDGIYFYIQQPIANPFIFSDAYIKDISVANGAYKKQQFEILSYITNETNKKDGSTWSNLPGPLPVSETEGHGQLEVVGNTWTNVPSLVHRHVPRPDFEDRVRDELLITDRHPIITLTGPGGIGKTTTALATILQLMKDGESPYEVILWISARDVDLLYSGPKPVSPKAVTKKDIARVAVNLLEPKDIGDKNDDAITYFQNCLEAGLDEYRILFVFDNFETVEEPDNVYKWIDAHIKSPNKVLITTRVRTFAGDYPIEIRGMNDKQAKKLINQHALRLRVKEILNTEYINELINESSGHPYVIQILLGEVAREQRAVNPKRVMASDSALLRALFERTYNIISRGSQKIFLLLSTWRVSVPEVVVEAVLLRPNTERFDVAGALDELNRYSLIERVYDNHDESFASVPLVAAEYGKTKLKSSEFKIDLDEDINRLREFGAGQRGSRNDAKHGILPRIQNKIQAIARRISNDDGKLEHELPILEFLASRIPKAYLLLAELVKEVDETHEGRKNAKEYIRRYLENDHMPDEKHAWIRLAEICEEDKDIRGEIHALCEASRLVIKDQDELGRILNSLNRRLKQLKIDHSEKIRSSVVQSLLERVCSEIYARRSLLNATNCSSLSWLHLNIKNTERACDLVNIGLEKDPNNEYCIRLAEKLNIENLHKYESNRSISSILTEKMNGYST